MKHAKKKQKDFFDHKQDELTKAHFSPSGHKPTRCKDCKWIHEADSTKNTAFIGVEFCPIHDRACNSHDALVSDLRQAIFYLKELTNTKPHFIKQAEANLKQAQ